MAAAWAVMQHLGIDGYKQLTSGVLETADAIRAGIARIDGIKILGDGAYQLIALASDSDSSDPIDVFALDDALRVKGWVHDRQTPPDSLHSTVSNSNLGIVPNYLADLADCVDLVRGDKTEDRSTSYSNLE